MLNCFKDYNKYINIVNHILDFTWPKKMKLTLEHKYMLSSYTVITMPAGALVTLGARALVGMVLTLKARIFCFQHHLDDIGITMHLKKNEL